MIGQTSTNIVKFLTERPLGLKTKLPQINLNHAATFQYSNGCVNATGLSQNYLCYGGDDKRLILHKRNGGLVEGFEERPCSIRKGHEANIFDLQISLEESAVYSAGNDGFLVKYDLESGMQFGIIRQAHDDAIHSISVFPTHVITAGQDCCLKLWDMRAELEVATMEQPFKKQNCVNFHPDPSSNLFVSADDCGGIYLWDMRTALASNHSKPVVKFNTKVSRLSSNSTLQNARAMDISSAKFSPDGKYIACQIQKRDPLLYSILEEQPVSILKSEDGGYRSLATIKAGDWSTTVSNKHVYFAGSDNCRVYGWEIDSFVGKESRQDEEPSEFFSMSHSGTIYKPPTTLSTFNLAGHKSVVNSVSCYPSLPFLISAGIEKAVNIYTPTKSDPQVFIDNDPRCAENDETIDFFNQLIVAEERIVDNYWWRGSLGYDLMDEGEESTSEWQTTDDSEEEWSVEDDPIEDLIDEAQSGFE